jgi:hypothetical protein
LGGIRKELQKEKPTVEMISFARDVERRNEP